MRTILLVIVALCSLTMSAKKIKLPEKTAVLAAMELANKHFIEKYPEAGAPTFVKKKRPSNLWTRGVYFEGLVALTDIERAINAPQYETNTQYLMDWASYHDWIPRNGIKTRDADDYCCCQTYLSMYLNGQTKTYMPTMECMDNLLRTPESITDWTWIDAIQMGLPVFTKLSLVMSKEDSMDGRCIITRVMCSLVDCSTRTKDCGGATKTSSLLTKSRMDRTAIGVAAMGGYMLRWFVLCKTSWTSRTTMIISMNTSLTSSR